MDPLSKGLPSLKDTNITEPAQEALLHERYIVDVPSIRIVAI